MLAVREQVKLEPATRKARGDRDLDPEAGCTCRLPLELVLTLGYAQ